MFIRMVPSGVEVRSDGRPFDAQLLEKALPRRAVAWLKDLGLVDTDSEDCVRSSSRTASDSTVSSLSPDRRIPRNEARRSIVNQKPSRLKHIQPNETPSPPHLANPSLSLAFDQSIQRSRFTLCRHVAKAP